MRAGRVGKFGDPSSALKGDATRARPRSYAAVRQRRRQHPRRAGSPLPFDSAQGTRSTDPHDPASVLRLGQFDKTATGMQMQFPTLTGKTYRLEYTDDPPPTSGTPLTDPIPGDGKPVLIIDPAGALRPNASTGSS